MSFARVQQPNYTQQPNVTYDDWMRKLDGDEWKLVSAICRRTFGYQRGDGDRISLSQLEDMTGLARSTVSKKVRRLVEKGLIEVRKAKAAHGGHAENVYRVAVTPLVRATNYPLSAVETTLVRDTNQGSSVAPTTPGSPHELPPIAGSAWLSDGGPTLNKQSNKQGKKDHNTALDLAGEEALKGLIGLGVTERIALRLVRKHGADRCLRQVAWLPSRKDVKSPAAYIVYAIEHDLPPPVETGRQRQAAVRQQQQQDESRRRAEESSAARARAEAELAALEPALRLDLEQRVRKDYEARWPGKRLPQPLLDVGVRALARGQALDAL